MPQTNFDVLKQEFDDEKLESYWKSIYEKIEDHKVAKKLLRSAEVLKSNRKAHVFCQRALRDLTGAALRTDGNFSTEMADAINFATRSGLSKQLRMTIAHYAANYVQIKVRKTEYGTYLKKLFE
jgi:hypothetical protein